MTHKEKVKLATKMNRDKRAGIFDTYNWLDRRNRQLDKPFARKQFKKKFWA